MSKKLLKCDCGGSYCEGSIRHFNTNKHLDYLKQLEEDNQLYLDIIALLCIEKFGGKERMKKAQDYIDVKMRDVKDRRTGLKSIYREIKGLRDALVEA